MEVRAVFFDVGETLVDETRLWEAWAATLGIPRFTFMAVVGGIIARGEHHDRVFQVLAPGFEPRFDDERFGLEDFYPDALPCLERLRASGFIVGMAGNQSSTLEQVLRDLGLSLDIIASAASLGVEKPSPEFFGRLAQMAGMDPWECAYVGDRIDNDVLPAREAGMVGLLLRRGPWASLQAAEIEAARPEVQIDSLDELPVALPGWGRSPGSFIRPP